MKRSRRRLRALASLQVLAFVLLSACGAPQDAPSPAPHEPARRLVPIEVRLGEEWQGSLSSGECHVLTVDLEAGQCLDFAVEQRGVDLATTLQPPAGGEAVLFDAPIGPWGREGGTVLAAGTGGHRLEVCGDPAGAYGLFVEEPRAAGEVDRMRAEGFVLYSRGRQRARDEEIARAIEEYEKALSRFRQAGAERPQAWASRKLGELLEADRPSEAAEHFAETVRIHEALGEPRAAANVLTYLGRSLNRAHRRAEALDAHRRSLRIAEDLGERGLASTALMNTAYLEEGLGLTLQAMQSNRRRRVLAVEARDAETEWDALRRIGKIYLEAGERSEALATFERTLTLATRNRLENQVTESQEDLGRTHLAAGEVEKAIVYFEQALELRRQREEPVKLAKVLNNLGRCYRRLDRDEEAREAFDEALRLVGGHEAGWYVEGLTRLNETFLAMKEGDLDTALSSCQRALSIFREHGEPELQASGFACLGRVHAARGELRPAVSNMAQAIEIVETFRGRSALEDLRAQYLADQYDYYEDLVGFLVQLEAQEPGAGHAAEAFQVAERSKARTLLDNLARTEEEIEVQASPELVAREAELRQELSELQLELFRQGSNGADAGRPAASVLQARLRAVEEKHALVAGEMFAAYPGWTKLLETRVSPLREIQAELLGDGETQLVSFLLGGERSHAWIVGAGSIHLVELPGKARIESLATQAARLFATSNQPHLRDQGRLTAEQLSRVLLAPLLPRLTARKLVLVKDGALHYVPFAALPVPGELGEPKSQPVPLGDRFELVEVPSASAAVALRRRPRGPRTYRGQLALFADPVFERNDERLRRPGTPPALASSRAEALSGTVRSLGLGELSRLPGSIEEARRISALLPPGELFLAMDFDANRETLLDRLAGYRILHLVGHGLAHPQLTGLLLSLYDREGRPIDGLVRAHDIYGLELDAELVTLSACRTGIGQQVRGEGLMGLSRSFLYAGASQVLASLWDVDDQATAELMERFYGALLRDGEAPARALQTAQRSLRRNPRWAAPHYWAGFVLQGHPH